MYSDIHSYFGISIQCVKAANIINKVVGSHSFKLLKKAEEEKNKRNSNHLKDLADLGQHPWQNKDKDYIEHHSKHLKDLANLGQHPWQNKDYIEHHHKHLCYLATQASISRQGLFSL